jgi:hypothetical protein
LVSNSAIAAPTARVLVAALLLSASTLGLAQTSTYTVPRNAHGQPDISGIWQAVSTAVWNIEPHGATYGVPGGTGVVVGGSLPYRESALEQRRENFETRKTRDAEANCNMVGVPRSTYMPFPFEILQTPDQIVMTYEWVHTIRNIYMTGEHPEGPIQWWMGDSRGHWEGDTLVVDAVHFTDQTWFDRSGNFHSESLHVVERYTRTGPDHMMYEVTIEDPEVFTQLWQMRMPLYRRLDRERLLEYECFQYADEERLGD